MIFDDLNKLYSDFFDELKIDKKTGIVNITNKRFATKIGIGEEYLSAKKRILFVSLDIGKDEYFKENRYQNFDERRSNALYYSIDGRNPHMAGVYGVAIYFLKNDYNLEEAWRKLDTSNKFFREALLANRNYIPSDILSKVALINFYNFVTIGREERTGGNDRFFINQKAELKLLSNIINTIKPDIIIAQSKTLKNYFLNYIKPELNHNPEIYVSYHPSVFGRGIKFRNPKLHIEEMISNGKL